MPESMPQIPPAHAHLVFRPRVIEAEILVPLPLSAEDREIHAVRDHVVQRELHAVLHVPLRAGIRVHGDVADPAGAEDHPVDGEIGIERADRRLELSVFGDDVVRPAGIILRLVELRKQLL